MKTTFIITAATLAGVLLVKLLMNKKEAVVEMADAAPVKRSHHLTDVFAQAKNHNE
ncbi:MAG: hypothetical protein IPI88_03855 [Chitinophagaceae bacterium]|nr:hypothetical protein [Chitinophagaceae bacterium]